MMDDNTKTKKRGGLARGLGRGLGALFEDEEAVYPQPDPQGQTPGAQRRMAGVDQLEPGTFQQRRHIDPDSIRELAESIKVHGVLQPILVRAKPGFTVEEGRFEIVAGERRWRAAQQAQLHEVPVVIGTFDDQAALEIGLIENLQREDINALDEAEGYKRLAEEFGHTQEKISAALGKSRSHIANMMRLLNLPENVKSLVRQSKLSAGHARALATMDAKSAEELAGHIIEQGLSVRSVESMVAAHNGRLPGGGKSGGGAGRVAKDVDTIALEEEIGNRLGVKVSIDMRGEGKGGTMKFDFKTLDRLDEILRRLSQNAR